MKEILVYEITFLCQFFVLFSMQKTVRLYVFSFSIRFFIRFFKIHPLLSNTTCAKKNRSLWKILDLFWLDQCKFIHLAFLTSLVFCTTPLRLNNGLHHQQNWFIQLVEADALGASLHLFANVQNYEDPFLPSQLLSMTLKLNKLHEIPEQFWILYNLSATATL